MKNLLHQKCVPCEGGVEPLKGKDLQEYYHLLHEGWRIVNNHHLEKEYKFPDFKHALEFTNLVGEQAEKEGHHPDIFLGWGKVKITLWTHAIDGLSPNDFILAAKCDQALSKMTAKT